jgi:hypothetical protein
MQISNLAKLAGFNEGELDHILNARKKAVVDSTSSYANQNYFTKPDADELLALSKYLIDNNLTSTSLEPSMSGMTTSTLKLKIYSARQYLVERTAEFEDAEFIAKHVSGLRVSVRGDKILLSLGSTPTTKKTLLEIATLGKGAVVKISLEQLKESFIAYMASDPATAGVFEHVGLTLISDDIDWFNNRLELVDAFAGKVSSFSIKVVPIV